VSTPNEFPFRVDTTSSSQRRDTTDTLGARLDIARELINAQAPAPHTGYSVRTRELPTASSSSFGGYSFVLVVVLAIAVLVILFLRSKRGHRRADVVTRRKLEMIRNREEDPERAPEPKWTVRDIEEGGRFHLSLPNGLEEDFTVVRRDRVDRPDERIEYDLLLRGADPDYSVSLNWWAMGAGVHAWLMEETAYTLDGLALTADGLREMRQNGSGTLSFREKDYVLDSSGLYARYVGGRRPAREFQRWSFKNEKGDRMVMIRFEEEAYTVLTGMELWLRDLTVLTPKAGVPEEPPEPPEPLEPSESS